MRTELPFRDMNLKNDSIRICSLYWPIKMLCNDTSQSCTGNRAKLIKKWYNIFPSTSYSSSLNSGGLMGAYSSLPSKAPCNSCSKNIEQTSLPTPSHFTVSSTNDTSYWYDRILLSFPYIFISSSNTSCRFKCRAILLGFGLAYVLAFCLLTAVWKIKYEDDLYMWWYKVSTTVIQKSTFAKLFSWNLLKAL